MALLIAGTAFMASPASAESFNNIQIFVTTSSSHAYSFQFTAYNLTGDLVASYQSSYPAAAFELPSGGYLFTVSATYYGSPAEYPCPVAKGVVTQGGSPATTATRYNESGSTPATPVCWTPSSEYGYATTTVSGPQTIAIKTMNVTSFPTTQVEVKVSYVNGTAAADASVYASIVGQWYYWWWQSTAITMGGQTDGNGVAHLVIPAAPAVITAWKWIPIPTDKNGSTVQTTVGGQRVNITVYWEPTYVGLSSSGFLLPPQDSMALTLRYQQPDYWVMPMGVASKGATAGGESTGTVASQPSGVPTLATGSSGGQTSSQYYLPAQIPAIQQSAGPPGGGQTSAPNIGVLAAATAAFIAVAFAAVFIAVRSRQHRSPPLTG